LYNSCLAQRKDAYEADKVSIKYKDQSARFKAERATNPYYARLNFSSAQATMRRLDKGFVAFFRRLKAGEKPGYPRFRGRDRYDSIEYPAYGDGIRLTGNRLRVQHVGVIRVKLHREVQGTITTEEPVSMSPPPPLNAESKLKVLLSASNVPRL
jgi:putative transposase